MSVKKARKLRDALVIAGAVIMLLGSLNEALFVVGVAVAVSGLVPHFLFNRCSHCGKQLEKTRGSFASSAESLWTKK